MVYRKREQTLQPMQDAADQIAPDRTKVVMPSFGRVLRWPLTDLRAEGAAVVLFIPLLLSLAMWNGFPFIFFDTGAYVLEGLGHVFLSERSPVYSLLLQYTDAGVSLWIVALAQALIVAFTIVETLRALAPHMSLGRAAGIGAGLVVFTGLPWFVGQIEPDCFTGVAVLSLYLLAFRREAIAGWRENVFVFISALAMAVHPSHLLLGFALGAVILGFWGLKHLQRSARWPDTKLLRPLLAATLGLLMVVAANYHLTGKVFVSRAGGVFVFARLLQDGIVIRLLDDTCPKAHYRLCAYRQTLPHTANAWLWRDTSPFLKLGRFDGTRAESDRIVVASLWRYPWMNLRAAAGDTVSQFVDFGTGDGIVPQQWILLRGFHRLLPSQVRAYLAARQQRGEIDPTDVSILDVAIGFASLAALFILLWEGIGRREWNFAILPGFILIALLVNAFICGALSNPHDRYQSRLIWLAPFALVAIAGDRARFALRGVAESGS